MKKLLLLFFWSASMHASCADFLQFAQSKQCYIDQPLLQTLYSQFLDGLTPSNQPFLIAVGGSPGSGKTTFRKAFLQMDNVHVHEMDEVMVQIPGYQEDVRTIGAKQAFEKWWPVARELSGILVQYAMQEGYSIVYDRTCGAEGSYADLKNAKEKGYHVRLIGLCVDKMVGMERILKREKEEGRVMTEAIFNEYRARFSALWPYYLKLVDEAVLYRTDRGSLEMVFHTEKGVVKEEVYEAFLEEGKPFREYFSQKHLVTPFLSLVSHYDAFLLDAHGVFWGSGQTGVLPGAAEMMKALVDQGKQVGILSNSTQLTAKEVEKFSKHGVRLGEHYHFIVTSGEITKNLLLSEKLPFPTPAKRYWLFGEPHPRFSSPHELFEGSSYVQTDDLHKADFIYLGIPHIDGVDQENPEVFRTAVQQVAARKIPVLCANPDRFAQEGRPPRPVVRQGSLAALFAECGASVHFIGKPSVLAYEFALAQFPGWVKKEKVLMVGDTPETDVRGARNAGLDAALVTETGIFSERTKTGATPNLLPETNQPHYFIERFALHGF